MQLAGRNGARLADCFQFALHFAEGRALRWVVEHTLALDLAKPCEIRFVIGQIAALQQFFKQAAERSGFEPLERLA